MLFGIKFGEWVLIVAAGLLLINFNPAYAGTVTGDLELSSDNEGLSTQRYLLGYRDVFSDGWHLGVKHGKFNVSDNAGDVSLNDTRITYYKEFGKHTYLWGYFGKLYNSNQDFSTGELGVGHVVNDRMYVEYNYSKNAFDSFIAINNRVAYDDHTFMTEYKFKPFLTGRLYGSLGDMSDGNGYSGYKATLKWDVSNVEGFSWQYHHRYKGYDNNTPGYFTPIDWTRNLFGAGYQTRLSEKWKFKGRFLVGPQSIDNTDGTFAELKTKFEYEVGRDTTIKIVFDVIDSTADGYRYNWGWASVQFEHRF